MPGTVLNVCTSTRKGTPKRSVNRAYLCLDSGLDGDAHAGRWHRQVSLLDVADIRTMEAKGLTVQPGAFGENLVISGIDTGQLGIGSRLSIDNAEIEISQLGKVCHTRCAIYFQTGDCIMPRRGLFARVTRPGAVGAGSAVEVAHAVPRCTIQAAVVSSVDGGHWTRVAAPMLRETLDAHIAWQGHVPDGDPVAFLHGLVGRGLDLVVVVVPGSVEGNALVEAVRGAIECEIDVPHLPNLVCGVSGSALLLAVRPGTLRREFVDEWVRRHLEALQTCRSDGSPSESPEGN
jgi:MOSC domain-containing protein YiiM